MLHKRTEILQEIIKKGGLYALAARLYLNDEFKGSMFIGECFEQCNNRGAIEHWGKKLVIDIVGFRVAFLRSKYEELYSCRILTQKTT